MKGEFQNKYRVIACLLLLFSLSPMANALDGQGTIKELVNCGATESGKRVNGRWKNIMLFKLSDNKWFGAYSDWAQTPAADYDSNSTISMLFMAFSSNLPVKVRANYATKTYCGISAAMFWDNANNYIKIEK